MRRRTEHERIDAYKDRWPFLELRKAIMRIHVSVSELCRRIISSSAFESFIILVILANVGVIIAEDPNEPEPVFATLERVFLYLYTTEAAMKIWGLGFVWNQGAYLRDWWNVLDFVIVVSAWAEFIVQEGVNLSSLRTLRLLRPLRSISSIKGLKVLLLALIASIRSMVMFLVVMLFFLLIFAIASGSRMPGSKIKCSRSKS